MQGAEESREYVQETVGRHTVLQDRSLVHTLGLTHHTFFLFRGTQRKIPEIMDAVFHKSPPARRPKK